MYYLGSLSSFSVNIACLSSQIAAISRTTQVKQSQENSAHEGIIVTRNIWWIVWRICFLISDVSWLFSINRILIFLFKIQIVNDFVYDRKLKICQIGKLDKLYIRAGNSLNYQGSRTFPVPLAFKVSQKERKANSNLSMEYRVLQGYHYITEPSSHGSSCREKYRTKRHIWVPYLPFHSG